MRTPRVVIIAAFLLTTVVLACISFRSSYKEPSISDYEDSRAGVGREFFSFNTPLSLFPPNAIISLTDDNTTYFLARPAAFGPLLPAKGLDGALWIGSGFGADSLRQGGISAGAEGELGCSDVPGWIDGNKKVISTVAVDMLPEKKLSSVPEDVKSERRKRGGDELDGDKTAAFGHLQEQSNRHIKPSVDDGTDDYLHRPLVESVTSKPTKAGQDIKADHADIQSIQEGAEIAGKVVLLSRGGCGFSEKTKWVQRRGGIALIVGDDTKGGPLIQMYAKGDTSNITIPSVFTSWTTAHLLSKLMPSGPRTDDAVDENGKPIRVTNKPKKSGKKTSKYGSQPSFDPANPASKGIKSSGDKATGEQNSGTGWLGFFSSKSESVPDVLESERSEKKQDWVLVEDWDVNISGKKAAPGKKIAKAASITKPASKDMQSGGNDNFVIGEQDWRDPDLIEEKPKTTTKSTKDAIAGNGEKSTTRQSNKKQSGVKGGSITPGSGEYRGDLRPVNQNNKDSKSQVANDNSIDGDKSGLLTKLFGDDKDESDVFGQASKPTGADAPESPELATDEDGDDMDPGHEGLWVTLTPTAGSSPFFDTLLVLVVSPLVTLTVVYALLLIRSRIRRRRWRAPKSVVERLPVRTYQTIPSVAQSRLPSPTSSSVTTPLLQNAPVRPRPRSRTTSGIPEPGELLRTNSDSSHISRSASPSPRAPSRGPPEHEKAVASEWKKYMGKQVECVVCLEEYVDGVSRVMSLPCGHEFHVDCITPWLTTRRRTCPICKGDVVRSLARGSPSTPRYDAFQDDSDDDIQVQAAETVNTSPAAALPVPTSIEPVSDTDLEQGMRSPTPSRSQRRIQIGSWRSLLSSSGGSSSRSPRPAGEDRTR